MVTGVDDVDAEVIVVVGEGDELAAACCICSLSLKSQGKLYTADPLRSSLLVSESVKFCFWSLVLTISSLVLAMSSMNSIELAHSLLAVII